MFGLWCSRCVLQPNILCVFPENTKKKRKEYLHGLCYISELERKWTDKEVEMIVKHWRRIHGFTQFGWINDFHPIIRKYL